MQEGHILIIGGGELGSSLQHVITEAGTMPVHVWDSDQNRASTDQPLPELVVGAHHLFLCIPTRSYRILLQSCRAALPPQCLVLSLAKGLDTESGQTADALLRTELSPEQPIALLSGPMLAEELLDGRTQAILASSSDTTLARVQPIFGRYLQLQHSSDIHGVAIAGVLKNSYALLLGMASALPLTTNAWASLITAISTELCLVGVSLGGQAETFFGLAGLGDLLATGTSSYSSHYQAGRRLVTGAEAKPNEASPEGLNSLPHLTTQLTQQGVPHPYLDLTFSIVKEVRSPSILLDLFA